VRRRLPGPELGRPAVAACVFAEAFETDGCESRCRRGVNLPLFQRARFDREAEESALAAERDCATAFVGEEAPALAEMLSVSTATKTAPVSAGR